MDERDERRWRIWFTSPGESNENRSAMVSGPRLDLSDTSGRGVEVVPVSAEPLSAVELEALLWAVRQCPLEALRLAGVQGRFGDGVGHGALSSATNKIERRLGALLDDADHETEEPA